MTDFKASVKIEFSIFGVTDKADMWINWWPDGECQDVDDRVIEFFRKVYRKGYAEYREGVAEYLAKANADDLEKAERAELARLQAKYDAPAFQQRGTT